MKNKKIELSLYLAGRPDTFEFKFLFDAFANKKQKNLRGVKI